MEKIFVAALFVAIICVTVEGRASKYLGCFYHNIGKTETPVFNGKPKPITSVKDCVNLCGDSNHQYAGLSYGSACFCQNALSKDVNKDPETACNMPCPEGGKMCGGFGDFSIYKVTLEKRSGNYLGCFYTNIGNTENPLFTGIPMTVKSADECQRKCIADEKSYAGVSFGSQCLCEENLSEDRVKDPDTKCNMNCPDGSKCGGFGDVSVYEVQNRKPMPEPVELEGCFYVNIGNTEIPLFTGKHTQVKSAQECIERCKGSKDNYAGLMYGSVCFCQKELNKQRVKDNDEACNMPCPSGDKPCGGFGNLSVYRIYIIK